MTHTQGNVIQWRCPACKRGYLRASRLPDSNAIIQRSCRDALNYRKSADWYPADDYGVAAGILTCESCDDVTAFVGQYDTDIEIEDNNEHFVSRFRPKFFVPPLEIFSAPARCPKEIKDELQSAFAVFWSDTSACLNHIRSVVERMLTDLKVKRYGTGKKGRFRLPLAERLKLLPTKHSEISDALNALRWLGNAGSHSDQADTEDSLDGFEVLDHVLEAVYGTRMSTLKKMTREILKRQGPRKRDQ